MMSESLHNATSHRDTVYQKQHDDISTVACAQLLKVLTLPLIMRNNLNVGQS